MKIKLVTVGKLKEKYLIQGINEYLKRLNSYAKMEIIEVPDEKSPRKTQWRWNASSQRKEGQRILGKINDNEYVFVLAINGKQLSSEEFSKEIEQLGISGKK